LQAYIVKSTAKAPWALERRAMEPRPTRILKFDKFSVEKCFSIWFEFVK